MKIYNVTTGGGITSIGVTDGSSIDSTGGPVTNSGNITLNVDLTETADMTDSIVGSTDELIILDGKSQKRKQIDEITLGEFNNDQNWNNYVHPYGSSNNHIPAGGQAGAFLKWQQEGLAVWDTANTVASNITDFDTEVSNNSSVAANTAKVSNSNHTGDLTGDSALTLSATSITGQTSVGSVAAADTVLLNDTGVGLRKATFTQLNTYFNSSLPFAPSGHNHSGADVTTGTLAVARGGTGVTTSTGTGSVVLSAAPTFSGEVTGRGIAVAGGTIEDIDGTNQWTGRTWGVTSIKIASSGYEVTLDNAIVTDDDMVILAMTRSGLLVKGASSIRVSDTVFRIYALSTADAKFTTRTNRVYFLVYNAGT
jgi:hypothetical protein